MVIRRTGEDPNADRSFKLIFSGVEMVEFLLIEEKEDTLVYWYFPEGKKDGHGIINKGTCNGLSSSSYCLMLSNWPFKSDSDWPSIPDANTG